MIGDPGSIDPIGGTGLVGSGADIGNGLGERGLTLVVELFEARALLAPVTGLGLLHDEQQTERDADRKASDALPV